MSSTHIQDDFEALEIFQAEFDQGKPEVVGGSSRGVVAINIDVGDAACAFVPGVEDLGDGERRESEYDHPALTTR